jgi:hypothetical protein
MKHFLNKSLELARALCPEQTDARRTFHFSMCWHGNKLLAIGQNQNKTSSRNRFNQIRDGFSIDLKGQCSEMSCFLKVKNKISTDFSKFTLVNVRIDRAGNVAISRPCGHCRGLIRYLSPKAVYFTDNEGEFQKY